MAHFTGRYWLNFDGDRAREPLIHGLSKKFDVVFNIRQATVNKDMGVMAVEFAGERETIKAAVDWLEQQGVAVEPVEIQTIEG